MDFDEDLTEEPDPDPDGVGAYEDGGEEEEEGEVDPMDVFNLVEILEEGVGATVFRAEQKGNGSPFAIKVLEFEDDVEEAYLTLESEVAQLVELARSTPSVLGYLTLTRRGTSLWVISEYCEGGSAMDAAVVLQQLAEDEIRAIVSGALRALQALHGGDIIHGNLRASNLLLSASGDVKVADFGQLGQLKRSTYWLSPETIRDRDDVTDKTDVWALGILCTELVDHITPYHGMSPEESAAAILAGPPPELEVRDRASAELNDFIARCLTMDPVARPTPAALTSHPFLLGMTAERTAATVQALCRKYAEKRGVWNEWAKARAKEAGQQVSFLPLCEIKTLFFNQLAIGEEEEDGNPGSEPPPTDSKGPPATSPTATTTPAIVSQPSPSEDPGESVLEILDMMGDEITRGRTECAGRRVVLRELIECQVALLGCVAAVEIIDCIDCTILIGGCRGTVTAQNCDHVRLTCAARSVRLEECADCNAFLCVSEPPVLAASRGIFIGPWRLSFPEAAAVFRDAGLDPSRNRYRDVVDLSQLDAAIPAPHYSLLEAADVEPQTVTYPDATGAP